MIKVNYKMKATSQCHTGAGENIGTMALLNRENRELINFITINSKFKNKEQRRAYIVAILRIVFKNIDQNVRSKNYGFYKPFASKILRAVCTPNKEEFLTKLCEACDIRTINNTEDNQLLIEALMSFNDDEFLETIRKEHLLINALFRVAWDSKEEITLSPLSAKTSNLIFTKKFEWIPYFPGNGLRGKIRRLLVADFFKRLGVQDESIPDFLYATPYDGGVMHNVEKLNKTIQGFRKLNPAFFGSEFKFVKGEENITLKEKLFAACPPLELLGCAIGNMTYEGTLGVRAARPICSEHGRSDTSYWEMISTIFETHLDNNIKTHTAVKKSDAEGLTPTQMKHELEVFNTGTQFFSGFWCSSDNPIVISAFWHALTLWKEYGHIGGKSSVGLGSVDMDLEIPEGANQPYLDYLEDNRGRCLDFFSVIPSAASVEEVSENGVLENV